MVTPSKIERARPTLSQVRRDPYHSYCYSYPHKTAYRALNPPIPLKELWEPEDKNALFLYFHIPFCEMRCGYCNLFAEPRAKEDLVEGFITTLEHQTERTLANLGAPKFARVAIGGGTPTVLSLPHLERLFDLADETLGASLADLPVSLETSPETSTKEKLQSARSRGIDRISIGAQSFIDTELRSLNRPQTVLSCIEAIERIREAGFPILNIDLIYGAPEQTVASWLSSIERVLKYTPEELYLYPLYVRPLTLMGRKSVSWEDRRITLYREGRDRLLDAGYEQISMRMFRRKDAPNVDVQAEHAASEASKDGWSGSAGPGPDVPIYRCQEDGMVGLGCGARSYTESLHYSSEWAVGARGVRELIAAWVARDKTWFNTAWYGFFLSHEEQRARYAIKSLLNRDGIDFAAYREYFKSDVLTDLPQLGELIEANLAEKQEERLVLTAAGLELSDAIGPWLYTDDVVARMESYELR